MNQNNSQNDNQGLINCADLISPLPFFTRVIYFSLIGTWLLDIITGLSSLYLSCSVPNTFFDLQIWTLFTSIFTASSLLSITIVIFNFNTFLPKLEQRITTPITILILFSDILFIQFAVLLVQYLIGYQKYPLNGIQGLWFSMLFKYCYYNPEGPIKFCCFDWKIKKIYYPFVLMGVIMVLRFSLPIDLMVGALYALFQVKIGVKLPTNNFCYQKLGKLINFSSIKCWISVDDNNNRVYSHNSAYQTLQSYQLTATDDKSQVNDPFNKQGYRLGDY